MRIRAPGTYYNVKFSLVKAGNIHRSMNKICGALHAEEPKIESTTSNTILETDALLRS